MSNNSQIPHHYPHPQHPLPSFKPSLSQQLLQQLPTLSQQLLQTPRNFGGFGGGGC